MQIQVQLFSILRDCLAERAGARGGQASLTLPEGTTLAELIVHLGIDRRLGFQPSEVVDRAGWQVMVNDRFEPDVGRILHDGDQVRIFPPVAGG
jgi:molybdopterin converting factor small subunit